MCGTGNVHEQFFIRHLFSELYCRRHEQVPKQFPNSDRPVHVLLEDLLFQVRQGEDSAKTPPRWLTNSGCIAQILSAWCDGAQKHQDWVGTDKISCRGFNVARTRYVFDNFEGNVPAIAVMFVRECGNGEDPCRVGRRR